MSRLDAQIAAVRLAWTLNPDQPRDLTEDERALLSSFMGWGQFAAAFAPDAEGKAAEYGAQLEEILPADAYFIAAGQVDTSFFTPAVVTDAVYGILRSVGFTSGRAFEPGCGAGAFMSAAPSGMDIAWTGIDIDPTSARIAKLLHPAAEVITGRLEKTEVRDGSFDIAIGNVPFSSTRVQDHAGRSGSLHNYFIQRAAGAVRDGGYVVIVTSRHTLDAESGLLSVHTTGMEGMSFAGAVRLPAGAFDEAGTSVVTDIIVLRRSGAEKFYTGEPERTYIRDPYNYGGRTQDNGLKITEPAQTAAGTPCRVSVYWKHHPGHVAGVMKVTTHPRSPLTVISENIPADVTRATAALCATLPPLGERTNHVDDLSDVQLVDADGRKEGSFHVIDGQMHKVEHGHLIPIRGSKELVSLVRLRDLTLELLALEAQTWLSDEEIVEHRNVTRAAYEQYVEKFGPLNRGSLVEGKVDEETGLPALSWRRPPMGGFRRDPDSAVVMALEVFDQQADTARPADILTRRVNRAPEAIERVDTAAEALAVSVGETGSVDLDRIMGLLGLASEDDARAALTGLVFDDPATGETVPAAVYLSGNVRTKLNNAEAVGYVDGVEALQAVVPADLGPLDIHLTLGHPLVRPSDVAAFVSEALEAGHVTITREGHLGTWEVDGGEYPSSGARLAWGTADFTPARLVEHALNNKMPEVTDRFYDPAYGDYRQVRNPDKSAAAALKLEEITDRFSTWVWENAERSERICREYNDRFNAYVARSYTGEGLTFPGMSDTFTPWRHQKAAVERIVSNDAALIGHPVGAGKSATAALAAITLRKFGLANKPLMVVPNHLLDQMAREVQQVIPTAKVLVATKDDLTRDNRRIFAARCATGDWDAVIMTHSAFTLIPVHPDVEAAWIQEEKYRLASALAEFEGHQGAKGAKAIARRTRALEQQLEKARRGITDPDAIFFDQLGIDYIMLDEAHLFRRLPTTSNQRQSNGMGSGSSKRATDLLLKVETLRQKKGPGAPVFAGFTGTPWSNTLAETWVWQRYMQPDLLDQMSMRSFDAWAAAFVKYETATEVSPDGSTFRNFRRPVGLINVAEIKAMLAQVADLINPADLETERPDVAYRTLVVEPTTAQSEFISSLAERAENLRNKQDTGVDNDNMLLVVGDGRKVALDPRLVGLPDVSPKVQRLAQEIADAYRQNKDRRFGDLDRPGGFQLVFCDLGTPNSDDKQTYGRLRRMLVDHGVPAEKVRFIHEATTDKARAALFASCRDGEVAVLLGSTPKVGMGTNVQTRLTDIWHLDAPWLPSEMIQRDGRGIRHGNLSGTVTITRLVVEGSFDAYMWQTLERKSKSFDALYAATADARELEDVSAATLSYGEVKALAAGNPLLLEQAEARTNLKKLRLLRAVHMQGVNAARDQATTDTHTADSMRRQAATLLDAAEVIEETGTPTIDMPALQRRIAQWQNRDGYSYYEPFTVGDFALRARGTRNGDRSWVSEIELDLRYNTISSWTLARQFALKSPRTIARWLAENVEKSFTNAAMLADALIERADHLDERAAKSRALVEAATFDREAELQQAIARLAEIESAIAEQVRIDQGEAVPA